MQEFQLIIPAPPDAPFRALEAWCNEKEVISVDYLMREEEETDLPQNAVTS